MKRNYLTLALDNSNNIYLTGSVKNAGTGKTGTTSYARFYLTDGVNDIFLKQLSVSATLAAGSTTSLSTTYRLPAGFPAGTYTI